MKPVLISNITLSEGIYKKTKQKEITRRSLRKILALHEQDSSGKGNLDFI